MQQRVVSVRSVTVFTVLIVVVVVVVYLCVVVGVLCGGIIMVVSFSFILIQILFNLGKPLAMRLLFKAPRLQYRQHHTHIHNT